jgi:peptide/nickel transport system substrate-binding protein
LKGDFKALLDEGVALVDSDERAEVYYQMNQMYYDTVPGIITVLPTTHSYEQKWLGNRVLNPIFSQDYYAPMTKTADSVNPDVITVVTSGDTDTLDPALAYDTSSGEIIQNVYETLIFYDGVATDKFVPQLATEVPTIENGGISADGKTWTFKIREGVKFHEGGDLTASDVAYSLQRGLLQGGYSSPQWLLAEPFFGVGLDDITMLVDEGASADDRESLLANDPAKLVAACETVKAAIVADDAAGTVTLNLAQAWGPMLPTLANSWGSIMDSEWVVENGGWDGSCDTWQNYYGMTSAEDPFTSIANGTGPYKVSLWTPNEETVLEAFDGYWGTPANVKTVIRKIVEEFGTRFSMLQQGDADIIYVPAEQRPQVDPLVGEMRVFDLETNLYNEPVAVCAYDDTALGQDKFTACADGETGLDQPLRMNIGRPQLQQDVLIFNFNIQP